MSAALKVKNNDNAPAGVEPTMGESKSPALPLGDGALNLAKSWNPLTKTYCFSSDYRRAGNNR